MGLKLWDDTLAWPRLDSGLGKLRKHSKFSLRSSSSEEMNSGDETTPRGTGSITIFRPPGVHINSGSTPPISQFSECQHRMHARGQV